MTLSSMHISSVPVAVVLLLFLCLVPATVQAAAPEKILTDGSEWTVNIDGFDFSIRLHDMKPLAGRPGWLRRGISGRRGKGMLTLKGPDRRPEFEMTVPVSDRRQVKCGGWGARDLSFLSGTCDGGAPFIMTPGGSPGRNAASLTKCQQQVRLQKKTSDHFSTRLNQCQRSLAAAKKTPGGPKRGGRNDARDIARDAARNVPQRGGGNCGKCDSAMELDVPADPKSSSREGQWLRALLSSQADAITDLFDKGGRDELESQERGICQGRRTCAAIFRQSVIAVAAEKLGQNR